jgi:hypothetical protein
MKFKLFASSLVLLASLLVSCDHRQVRGSGNIVTEKRRVENYREIEVKGSMDVFLTQGPLEEAVIEADDNILPYLELVNEGDRLIIRTKRNTSLNMHDDIKVRLTAPDIRGLSLSGSGNIKLVNTLDNTSSLKINLSGSGDISGAVHAPEVKSNITGSGNILVGGETRDLNVSIAGSGSFEGKNLMAENADVNIAGSGDADLHASVSLNAHIVGSGDVNYKGNPQVSSKVVGSGSVHKRD